MKKLQLFVYKFETLTYTLAVINEATTSRTKTIKVIQDRNGKAITKGTVVHYGEGWMRVRSVKMSKSTVNLGPVFGGMLKRVDVPVAEVYEDEDAFMANWSKSETYASM